MDFQAWLDEWADCILAGNYDGFRRFSHLPFEMVTPKGSWIVHDESAYRLGFEAYLEFLSSVGATLIARSLRSVERLSRREVVLHYDNHIMRDSQRVLAPSGSRANLVAQDGMWRARRVEEIHHAETAAGTLPVLETFGLHRSHAQKTQGRAAAPDINPRPGGATGDEND